jgi:hypothetical protein
LILLEQSLVKLYPKTAIFVVFFVVFFLFFFFFFFFFLSFVMLLFDFLFDPSGTVVNEVTFRERLHVSFFDFYFFAAFFFFFSFVWLLCFLVKKNLPLHLPIHRQLPLRWNLCRILSTLSRLFANLFSAK